MITLQRDRGLTLRDILDLSSLGPIDESGGFGTLLDTPFDAFRGFDYEGFNERGDIITETKDGFPLNKMWDDFQKTVRMWNEQRNALIRPLTFNVTQLIEGVRYPVEEDFEEASEFGVATPLSRRTLRGIFPDGRRLEDLGHCDPLLLDVPGRGHSSATRRTAQHGVGGGQPSHVHSYHASDLQQRYPHGRHRWRVRQCLPVLQR